jgi:hypothetical protein
MRSATTLTLLVAVLALGSYVWFVERKADSTDRRQELARRALRFDPDKVKSVRIVTDRLQAVVEKQGDQWRLTSPMLARADAGEVSRILDNLELLDRGDVITSRQQRKRQLALSDFGLDQPRARIVLDEGDRELTLLIGRDTPLGGNLFIKEASDSSVLTASTNLLADLPASVAALRDRRLFLGFPGESTRLDLKRRDGLLQLARDPSATWRVQKPFVGRAAYDAVQDLLDALYAARAADFVADSFAAASLYGLDEPAAQITIVGDPKYGEQVLLLGKPIEGRPDQVYATVQGTETVIAVDQKLLAAVAVKAEDLRDHRLLTLPAYDIGYIEVREGERSLKLARQEDGVWSLTEPRQFQAHDERVQAILSEWTGLRVETFLDQPGTNLAALGFAPPARRITFARRAPAAGDEATTLLVSSQAADAGLITVQLLGEETLYRVRDDGLRALPMDPLYYRDLAVLQLDPASVRSVTVQAEGREQGAMRDAPTNGFRAAVAGAELAAPAVDALVAAASRLQAVAYVEENPVDLAAYGLDAPEAVVTLGLTGEGAISKSILLGAEASPGTVYALVRGLDVVFTLDKAVRDKFRQPLYKVAATTLETPVAERPDTHRDPAAGPAAP